MNNKNLVEIPVGDNKLIVQVNDWNDGMPKEIFVSLVDKDGGYFQDICMVREHFRYNKNTEEFEVNSSFIDCKVWADSDNEDYTHEFTIGVYEEEEEC